jgi:hypothetical protein
MCVLFLSLFTRFSCKDRWHSIKSKILLVSLVFIKHTPNETYVETSLVWQDLTFWNIFSHLPGGISRF